MDILEGLNEEQRAAVCHDTGPQLVIAGAGTGKTQVITRRIAYLIEQGRAKPHEILALTFTEKAAREMSDRLYGLIGWESFQVPVLTFNAFGAELLGRYASHIGRSVRGGLINDTQKTLLLYQHFGRIELRYYGPQPDLFEFLESITRLIGEAQNAGVSAEDYSAYVARLRAEPGELHPQDIEEQADIARMYTLYEELKRETGTYDYADQLRLPLEILAQRPNVAERLSREYRYVLVDEYQDTNSVQDGLLRSFIPADGNIFAVGDDDQAIYGFRGAKIDNILSFADHFAVREPVVLVQNYRSGQAVLDAAYTLIQNNNPERLEHKLALNKRLLAQHNDSTVQFRPYTAATLEQAGIVEEIASRVDGGQKPGTIAVLASTHAPLKLMAKALERRDISYALSTAVSIFEQPELIGLWYVLKWLKWQANDETVVHVMMGPFVGWAAEDVRRVVERSRQDFTTFEEALRLDESAEAQRLCAQIDEWRDWTRDHGVSRLAYRLIFETGLAQQWQDRAADSPRMVRVFEDLGRLLAQMQDFEQMALSPTLEAYLEAFPKPPSIEVSEPAGDADGVQLLTVHSAKGLEFETVFVMNVTQRAWSARSGGVNRGLPEGLARVTDLPPEHELRRLMYVAVTRARTDLILTAATQTNAGSKQAVSSFVGEMLGDGATENLPLVSKDMAVNRDSLIILQQFYPMKDHFQYSRLPFETEDGWLELGVTALSAYEFCPFEFYLQHVLKIAQPIGPQLSFGTALHKAFERYYKEGMKSGAEDVKSLHHVIDEAWETRAYTDARTAEQDLALAHATLDRFIARESQTPRVVVGSELPIRFELPEAKLRLRGKIDILFARADGLEVRDFKTGRTKTDAEQLAKSAKQNFQLRTYALACQMLKGEIPAAVVLDYVVTMTEGEAVLSAKILQNHAAKLSQLADDIRARKFAPNPSALHNCAAIRYYGTGEIEELQDIARMAEGGVV
jgi:DNA helicase-2/ATP-dependent DNA helicase PcrA